VPGHAGGGGGKGCSEHGALAALPVEQREHSEGEAGAGGDHREQKASGAARPSGAPEDPCRDRRERCRTEERPRCRERPAEAFDEEHHEEGLEHELQPDQHRESQRKDADRCEPPHRRQGLERS
jgi:hypothetical protein